MTRTKYQLMPPDEPGFLGSLDTTLGGSRSGFSPMILWDYFARLSYEDNMQKALDTENIAAYFEAELRKLEKRFKDKFGPEVDLWIARSRLALTVRFRLTNPTLNYKWTFDTDRLWVPISESKKQLRSYSHIFMMHSVTKEKVDRLIHDLWETGKDDWTLAFPTEDNGEPNPGPIESYTPPKK